MKLKLLLLNKSGWREANKVKKSIINFCEKNNKLKHKVCEERHKNAKMSDRTQVQEEEPIPRVGTEEDQFEAVKSLCLFMDD